MQRRQFVKLAVSATTLALGGVAAYQYFQQQQLDYSGLSAKAFLTEDDQVVLTALIPALVTPIKTIPSLMVIIENIDQAIARLVLQTQQELRELFDLLASAIGRLVFAGVWRNWQASRGADIASLFSDWREHHLSVLQQAYVGLHQLIYGAIYAETDTWPDIGYPGPPRFSI